MQAHLSPLLSPFFITVCSWFVSDCDASIYSLFYFSAASARSVLPSVGDTVYEVCDQDSDVVWDEFPQDWMPTDQYLIVLVFRYCTVLYCSTIGSGVGGALTILTIMKCVWGVIMCASRTVQQYRTGSWRVVFFHLARGGEGGLGGRGEGGAGRISTTPGVRSKSELQAYSMHMIAFRIPFSVPPPLPPPSEPICSDPFTGPPPAVPPVSAPCDGFRRFFFFSKKQCVRVRVDGSGRHFVVRQHDLGGTSPPVSRGVQARGGREVDGILGGGADQRLRSRGKCVLSFETAAVLCCILYRKL